MLRTLHNWRGMCLDLPQSKVRRFSQILCNDFIRASRIYATWDIIIKKLHDTSIRRIPLYIHVMLTMNIFADIISVFRYVLTLLTLTS
jgi:hypothetical protein